MKKRLSALLLAAVLFPLGLRAQFYNVGTEPSSTKWREIKTESFRLVYPEKMDSLAKAYAASLEEWKPRVAATIGYAPNGMYRKPMPVVFHPLSITSNGSVAWAPRKMDLFPTPDSSDPMPWDWKSQLVCHESRHVSQMQFPSEFKFLSGLVGEMWHGAAAAIYGGPAFLEGDAVSAETELSSSGRGRMASFLEYHRVSYSLGEYRNYWQWRGKSLNRFTPDHYTLGYITEAGRRSITGSPYYARDFYKDIADHGPLRFFNLQRSIGVGKNKNFASAFRELQDEFVNAWQANDEWRRSECGCDFLEAERVTSPEKRYVAFRDLAAADGRLFALRSGLDRECEIVEIRKDGSVRKIRGTGGSASKLKYNPYYNRLYYTLARSDARWSLRSWSEVNFVDSLAAHGRITDRTRYFNTSIAGTGMSLLLIEYPEGGGSRLVETSAYMGESQILFSAPDGVQLVESCEVSDKLFLSAINENGSGIFLLENGKMKEVLPASRVTVKDLFAHDGYLFFTADRDGTDQLYRLRDNGEVEQVTNTRFGANDFAFVGEDLYFVALSTEDRGIWKVPSSKLLNRKIDWKDVWKDPIAEKLSLQAGLALKDSIVAPASSTKEYISNPYSKFAHLFRFHSWVPLYVDFNAISSMSSENLTSSAGLGATAFFHNDLNTIYGTVGVSAWTPAELFNPGFHATATYCGLYPVFEATVNVSQLSSQGVLKAYIPWNLSSDGWSRGIIPQAAVSFGKQTVGAAALRAYATRNIPTSCIYPRWGIGGEVKINALLGGNTSGDRYSTVEGFYAYIPGFARTHGIKLTAQFIQQPSKWQNTFTATYTFPFADVNWTFLGPVAYIRNFEAALTGVCAFASSNKYGYGARCSLSAVLGNFLWIPFDTRIGIMAMYDYGAAKRMSFGAVLSIAL